MNNKNTTNLSEKKSSLTFTRITYGINSKAIHMYEIMLVEWLAEAQYNKIIWSSYILKRVSYVFHTNKPCISVYCVYVCSIKIHKNNR